MLVCKIFSLQENATTKLSFFRSLGLCVCLIFSSFSVCILWKYFSVEILFACQGMYLNVVILFFLFFFHLKQLSSSSRAHYNVIYLKLHFSFRILFLLSMFICFILFIFLLFVLCLSTIWQTYMEEIVRNLHKEIERNRLFAFTVFQIIIWIPTVTCLMVYEIERNTSELLIVLFDIQYTNALTKSTHYI